MGLMNKAALMLTPSSGFFFMSETPPQYQRTFVEIFSMDIISISDCLKHLETGEIVELEVWKYDRKRKKGGDVEGFSCRLLKADEADADLKPASDLEMPQNVVYTEGVSRNPNHRSWYTRNVRIVANGHPTAIIRKIHPPLIKSLNGIETVV